MNSTATAGETFLKAGIGTPRAAIFSTSYGRSPAIRTGPSLSCSTAARIRLGMAAHGAFGPKRVAIPSDATTIAARLTRSSTIRMRCSTSRHRLHRSGRHRLQPRARQDRGKEFWGVTKDAESVRSSSGLWLNDNGRWNSPKYLGGESYGTTRTAAVVNQLEGQYNDVALNGLILISTVLDFARAPTRRATS
jgi:hypothetical protein